jgi:hypothetical protein
MKIAYLIFALLVSTYCFGQNKKTNPQLAKLVDSLYQADQHTAKIQPTDSAVAAYQRAIRSNFPYIKQMLDQHGYPGYDLLGKESADNYFLLVQHSDFDVPFQKRALKLMKEQIRKQNASGKNFAFLTDRVNINEGKPQIYGTQVLMSGDTKLKPCKDLKKLDKRRKSVGLEPISEYLEKCNDVFYQLNPDQKRPEKKR